MIFSNILCTVWVHFCLICSQNVVWKWGKATADGFSHFQKKQRLQSWARSCLQRNSSTVVKSQLRKCAALRQNREKLVDGGVISERGREGEVRVWLTLVDGWWSRICCRPRPLLEHIWKSLYRGSGNCKQPPNLPGPLISPSTQLLPLFISFFLSPPFSHSPFLAVNLSASYCGRL